MHSNHRPKIRFQGIVYLEFNKWRAKRLKNTNKKTSNWCAQVIRKQKIILIFYSETKRPIEAEKIE